MEINLPIRKYVSFADEEVETPALTPEQEAEARWQTLLESLFVPPRYRTVTAAVKVPTQAEGWAGDPWSVTVLGPAGTGKTWIAVKLLTVLCADPSRVRWDKRTQRARFYDISTAIEQIKAEFGTDEAGVTLETMMCSRALVMDDLGAERETDFTKDQVSVALRNRYNQMLPTIITSNAANLGELGDQRIASRLSDGIVITLSGKDRRGKR